jgi:hypothetical protein
VPSIDRGKGSIGLESDSPDDFSQTFSLLLRDVFSFVATEAKIKVYGIFLPDKKTSNATHTPIFTRNHEEDLLRFLGVGVAQPE